MDGIRKIGPDYSSGNYVIHPIFLTMIKNTSNDSYVPIVPIIENNTMITSKISDGEKLQLKQLVSYVEKPYISINSKMLLDLKKINNLIDIEDMLDSNKFKNDSEFRYYFNIFIRLNLNKISNIQLKLLNDFLIKYFKNKSKNINYKVINNIIDKWKEKKMENNFYYKFIEYVENTLKNKF